MDSVRFSMIVSVSDGIICAFEKKNNQNHLIKGK